MLIAATLLQVAGADAAGRPYFPTSIVAPRSPCAEQSGPSSRPVISSLERDWFSGQLRAAGEPSLASENSDQIRFTWLRSFHRPVTVRVEGITGPHPRLLARELTGRGGYSAGIVGQHLERSLTNEEVATLQRKISASRPFEQAPVECGVVGVDGAEWVLEGVDHTGYHLIIRWSPDAGSVHDVGLAMLKLTGWALEPIY